MYADEWDEQQFPAAKSHEVAEDCHKFIGRVQSALVTILALDQVNRLSWEDGDTSLLIERHKDLFGEYSIVEVGGERFVGNDVALRSLDDFAQLKGLRELSEGRFTKGEARVRLDNDTELIVGDAVFGSRDRFVRHGERVFLVSQMVMKVVEHASTRLRERRLFPEEEGQVFVVTRPGKDPVVISEVMGMTPNRLRATRSEVPDGLNALEPGLVIEVGGTRKWLLKFVEHEESIYIHSEFQRGWVSPPQSLARDFWVFTP
ncbi:MAG: hypothetical protein HN348_20215 [Proteobacteria bacterium]|nr:hypothetical protein [Pseudomonadota bacterium]